MIKVTKTEDFEEKLRRHNKKMEENQKYRETTEQLTFAVGTKLELCIEVTDEYYSHNLQNLIRGNLEGGELLGFKVNELVINPEEREKEAVRKFLMQAARDYKL